MKLKRSESVKFLDVFLDENLTLNDHIKYTEKKTAKNMGLLLRFKRYLTKKCLLSLYTVTSIPTYITLT